MELSGWIMMVLILGFVWGGFLYLAVTAFRKEGRKGGEEE